MSSPLLDGVARTTSPTGMDYDEDERFSTLRKDSNDIENGALEEETSKPRRSRTTTVDRRTAAENRIKAADEANEALRDPTFSVRVVSKVCQGF